MVFKRSLQGEIIISNQPDISNMVWSEAQEARWERFWQASAYATRAKVDANVKSWGNVRLLSISY